MHVRLGSEHLAVHFVQATPDQFGESNPMSARGTYQVGVIAAIVITIEVLAWAFGVTFWLLADRYLPQFRLANPDWHWALLVGPLLTLLFLIGLGYKNRALQRFSGQPLLPWMVPGVSSWRTALKFLLVRHGLSFALFALMGPQMGTKLEEVKARGVDVVVAMDVSNSMLAEDLRPNRMEVARRALTQLIEKMQGDRLGIVVFAGTAYTQLPITADRSAAKLFLANIGPGMVSTQGTAIGAAIEQARKSFQKDAAKGRAIIVISDGESFEDDGESAAKAAASPKTRPGTTSRATRSTTTAACANGSSTPSRLPRARTSSRPAASGPGWSPPTRSRPASA